MRRQSSRGWRWPPSDGAPGGEESLKVFYKEASQSCWNMYTKNSEVSSQESLFADWFWSFSHHLLIPSMSQALVWRGHCFEPETRTLPAWSLVPDVHWNEGPNLWPGSVPPPPILANPPWPQSNLRRLFLCYLVLNCHSFLKFWNKICFGQLP